MTLVHASCVAIDGAGVLIRGDSGSGKSDLALRLIDSGALLVADDQVDVSASEGRLLASPPRRLRGRLEVRGVGIVDVPAADSAPVRLVAELRPRADIERLPEPQQCRYEGVVLPLVAIDPFEPSAPAKLRLALRRTIGHGATGP